MRRTAVAGTLLLVAALTAGACGPGRGREVVRVEVRDSRFVPDSFEFAAGTTVTFEVTNGDPISHEFIIGDEEKQQIHEEGTEAHHSAKPGEISIPIGQTRTTTYTFDEPGTLLVGCHLPGHWDYGMRGKITVTQ